MEQRNPYAAPKAPVDHAYDPAVPLADSEVEYGGFWRRVGAMLLDGLILAPLAIGLFIGLQFTRNAYLYYAVPSVLVHLFYYVYLVQKYGGTPGKRITRMRITMQDGAPVTFQAAFVRFAPLLLLTVLSLLASIIALSNVGVADFESMSYLDKMRLIGERAPKWNTVVTVAIQVWWVASAITLIANRRKRAVHDFLAGTVVVRDD